MGRAAGLTRERTATVLRGGCSIPPPCWVPQSLGTVSSLVCEGGTARLRVVVSNCGIRPQLVQVDTRGDAKVHVDPSQATLDPLEEATFTATIEVGEAPRGTSLSALVLVRGCRAYYLRWTVRVGAFGSESIHEVLIDDCPDLIHHWYDHFYCDRPCLPSRQRDRIDA